MFVKPILELMSRLLDPKDGEIWLVELYKFLQKESCWVREEGPRSFLQRLFDQEGIIIPPCDGTETLKDFPGIYSPSCHDPVFLKLGLDSVTNPTSLMEVAVFKIIDAATFSLIFNLFLMSLDELCFTPHQVLAFCEENADKLRECGNATFFLVKGRAGYLVFDVSVASGRFVTDVHRFGHDEEVWHAKSEHRVVVPLRCTQKL